MAMENKRIIQLSTERTTLGDDDYTIVDSDTNGTAKYRLSRLKETDTTLSVSGMAADAAATGQAINAETQARTQAVAAETQARQQAISAESQARAAADTTLGNDVQDLKSAIINKAWDIGSYNRLDKTMVTTYGVISKTGAISANDYWKITDYIPLSPGETIYAGWTNNSNFALFDFDKNVVSNSNNWSNPFTVPSGVYYVRFTVDPSTLYKAYVSTKNGYDDYSKLLPYIHGNFESFNEKYTNLAKKTVSFSVSGILNKETGAVVSNSAYACTPLIPLVGFVARLQYKLKSYNNIAICCYYDANSTFISSESTASSSLVELEGMTGTYPDNAAYIRFCSNIENSYVPFIGVAYIGDGTLKGEFAGFENITFKKHDDSTNLIDPDNTIPNCYINGSTGAIATASGLYATLFIPMDANTQYYFNSNYVYAGYAAFYNSNKEYISGYGQASGSSRMPTPFTTPANTAYGRFTIASQANLANAWLCRTNQMAEKPADSAYEVKVKYINEKPTDYKGNEINVFNKILCIGDSLTDGFFNESEGSRLIIRSRSYPAKLQALTGIDCTNMGYAGYTSVQWYEAYQSEDLSGHDACIIQLGVNDQLFNVSESDMDTALSNIITKVKTENKGIKIFVATIVPANGYMTTGMRSRSEMIRGFVEDLNDDNVYLIDLWTYGKTDDYLAYDAGHLSALGYLRLAEDYKAYIGWIIHNNINDFRYVQFIGTDYTYSGDTGARQIEYP